MNKRKFVIDMKITPDLAGMMLVTVEALKELGGSASIQELEEKVVELECVTEAEQTYTMSRDDNRNRLNYYLAWARTHLKRGNALLNSSRGVWALTEIGTEITQICQTNAILERSEQGYRGRRHAKRRASKKSRLDDFASADVQSEEEDWKSSLLVVLGTMQPDSFERLSQRLLREAGFTKVEVRGKSGDGGIDGVGVLRVNLVSFQIYFQCKRWKGSVGAKEIRDFRGALQGRADKGLFITTGYFTGQASDEATRDGAIAIDPIDGGRLCDLLREYRLGVETEMIEKVQIKADWFEKV